METLQRGLATIEEYLKEAGLKPSAEKTRFMVFGHGWEDVTLDLTFDGDKINKTEVHTILGIHLNSSLNPTTWIRKITSTWKQGLSIIRRVASKLGGIGERIARTIVQAALISKVLYGLRFYRLQKKHMAKLETLLNEARRCISGLPRNTKLEKLHECVAFPSFAEMAEQQEEIQILKLKHTKQGETTKMKEGSRITSHPGKELL
ncbi:hypothetical protein HPB47_012392 [Ixodes persulcatus]|uniref:Uncharacterized protein n=1 Tax=Ixodes persulcatus TaxID=34615 RepID=A0AC60NTS3_IXOPE|nr:hypothetical protein HPB47_012392 [Ixodes persulcatus]